MIKLLSICLMGCLLLLTSPCKAQFWPFKKASQAEKASKDLDKRERNAGEGNMFNPLQRAGSGLNDARNDHIWSAATARTSYPNAGNIAFTSPSRYGLNAQIELLSWLGLAYWTPNLFVKREISREKLWVSSLHGAYSSWPGFSHVKNGDDTFLADSVSRVPRVLSLKNQLLLSRPFYSQVDCNPEEPFLILSASLALDYGIAFDDEDVFIEEEHLFTPRSVSYAGEGLLATLGLRADWQAMSNLFVRGEIRALTGSFPSGFALEQQSNAEFFPFRNLSFSAGYVAGYGKFGSQNLSLWPFLDISIYFGIKKKRHRGLFGEQMF